jgi:hypothetical protein
MSPIDPARRAPSPDIAPPLQAFQEAAQTWPSAGVHDAACAKAQFGPAPLTADGVIWIRDKVETTAMEAAFGESMAQAIARELALQPAPERPILASDVHRAVELGETSRHALAGVDFGTRLRLGAVVDGPEFHRIAQDLGVNSSRLTPQVRQAIDARMGDRFEQARLAGQSPVPVAKAEKWLRIDLLPLTM